MKLNKENLKGFRITKFGNYTKDNITYYLDVCENCGEKFLGKGQRLRFCCLSCARSGENNPFFNKHHTQEIKDKIGAINKIKNSGENCFWYRKKLTKEHRKNISKAKKGKNCGKNNPFYGKTHTKETREKISKANKNKIISKETREKISVATKGENNPNYDKPMSKEQKEKISTSRIGKCCGEDHYLWKGGWTPKGYCKIFSNKEFKQMIRNRDGDICLNCNKTKYQNGSELCGHHIDYNKMNCEPKNIITLCNRCNLLVNHNREWWTEWFQIMMNHRYGYKYV